MAAFTDIEHRLRSAGGNKAPLAQVAREYLTGHGLDMFLPAFGDFVELRNLLAHSRRYDGHLLASPAPGVVAEIERLREVLLAPPKAVGVLGHDAVITCTPDDQLATVLGFIADYGIATIPVYADGSYAGLLTHYAVARWLASRWHAHDDAASVPVREVLGYAKAGEDAGFVDETAGAPEVVALLTGPAPAPAVLVTPSASRHREPITIATAGDLPRLLEAITG